MWHYIRLVYRTILFLATLIAYIYLRIHGNGNVLTLADNMPILIGIVWVVFMTEMIFRFFPSKIESPGCQKQFSRNYLPTGKTHPVIHDNNATFLVALIWLTLNGLIGWLYLSELIDDSILILISLAYSICDLICILFFCPFQSWFLKNKCCISCRIYNWDYAMMFTPLFFIRRFYSRSLLIAAMLLLLRWELTIYRYPERFSEETNSYLNCTGCTEKLCSHKKQLHTLWKRFLFEEKENERRIRNVK